MKVKMLTPMSGPKINLNINDEYDCEKEEAIRLIKAGFAIHVEDKKTEQATKKTVMETR